jgi:PAS domain S-box-containing protein
MYVDSSTVKKKNKSYTRHLLRTSFRENGKVKHKTIANLSGCSEEEIRAIKLALKHKDNLSELVCVKDIKTVLHDTQQKLQYTQKKLASIQESEHLYRSVVDNARDAIYLMDIDSEQLIYANQIAQKMIGRSIEEIRGISLYRFVKVKEKDISKARLERLLNGETLEPQEYTIFSPDGKKILGEAKSFLIELKNRKIAVNFNRDISHLKKAEAKLKESERRYRLIMDKAEDAIFLTDAKTVMIIDANKAAQNMLGKTLDEIKEMTIFDMVSHADRDIIEKRVQKLIRGNTVEPQEYPIL